MPNPGSIAAHQGHAINGLTPTDAVRTGGFITASLSPATLAAYAEDQKAFGSWCNGRGILPDETNAAHVAAWLSDLAASGRKASGIARARAALTHAYKRGGYSDAQNPARSSAVDEVMAGIRRSIGTAPKRKAAATADMVAVMISRCPDTMRGKRDRALLALGFGGAFRRSELVALNVEDIECVTGGLRVTIRRSKTDQEGAGQVIGIVNGATLRASDTLTEWLAASGITEGPIFRAMTKHDTLRSGPLCARGVADIIKHYAALCGYNPDAFSGHSLRAGFITSGARAGISALSIAKVSRHKNLNVLQAYVRDADPLADNPGAAFM